MCLLIVFIFKTQQTSDTVSIECLNMAFIRQFGMCNVHRTPPTQMSSDRHIRFAAEAAFTTLCIFAAPKHQYPFRFQSHASCPSTDNKNQFLDGIMLRTVIGINFHVADELCDVFATMGCHWTLI